MGYGISIIKTDNSMDCQKELWEKADSVVDLTSYRGLRFCSRRQLLNEISAAVDNLQPGICFLGSGDFHHLSLMLLSNLGFRPILVLIDHHTDMYEAFPDMVDCGSWVMQALKEKRVKKCIVIGIDSEDPVAKEFRPNDGYVSFFPVTIPKDLILSQVLYELSQSRDPIYISIDKDVLCTKDAATGWDQGIMRLEELSELLLGIKKTGRVMGVDVCGEWVIPIDEILFNREDIKNVRLNQTANIKILETMLN